MSGCGGPAGLASPAPATPPPPRSRMARRPELLCGAAALLAAACLAALKVSCGRAKDVTMPARLPVNFFSSTSPVVDFFLGQLDHAEFVRQDSEIALFFFYAPWCGQSIVARDEIEKVAGSLADQVLFVAINCWWNQGKCRKQKHFFYFPVIYLYHRSFGPIEYKGPLNAVYIEKFVRRVMTPLQYVSSHSKLQKFLSSYEPGVLGYFEFNASPQPPGYLTFFASALYSLNKDYLGTIHFGVITDKLVAKEIPLTNSGSIYLHRHVNTSLFYPHEAMNYTTENICKWALENRETFVRWLRPHGGKSLLLNNELKKGPALLLFLPFDPLAENQTLVDEISRLALAYNSCNRSDRGEAGAEGGRGLPAHPVEDPFPISKSPCCNTVVLPPQLHAISRTHNVCELCVNQTVGVKPSQLSGLRCSFFEIEAALDSFYLKERTFFHIVSKTASLCSNFPSFYSPFSYYTACCRTVNGAVLGFFGPEKTAIPPFETAFSSHGKKWEEEHRRSIPHIEDQKGLLAEHSLPSSGVTGLVCRANKTLNLYLLDSNLFWMYAERLGAPRLTFTRQFATIVDLREEAHYVLDRNQALVRPHLETFIRNYSVLYSPLKRHLVGIPRPVHVSAQHSIREVATDTFHEVVLKSDKDVLLVYYAPWCGFCAALNHVFIQVAQILPDNFVVARVDVSQNDLPWEFMTDHLPNILLFPRQRKDQSVKFPEDFPITLPNLLKFLLRHSSPPSSAAGSQPCLKECLQQGRVSLLEKEVQKLRAEVGALREAQALLRGQLSEARNEEQRLQQEAWLLRKQQGHLHSHHEHLQELYDQKATQLEELAGKLQELAEASKTLLTENALLKVLLASVERKPGMEAEPEISLTQEEEGEDLVTPTAEKNENTHLDARITSERSKENWTE